MNEIEQHPDYEPTYRRWYSVCLAAGRSRAEAEERARGHALLFVGRRIERQRFYEGAKRVGPTAVQAAEASRAV